jgi:hypothetical protein
MLAGLNPAIFWQGCWLALSLPQHCLACLEGPCSKGGNHCKSSSVECASLKLVSTLSHQGHWQGPLAGASGPVSVLGHFNLHVWHKQFYRNRTKELRGIYFRTFHCSLLNKNLLKNRLRPCLAADFFPETGHLLIRSSNHNVVVTLPVLDAKSST